MFGAEATRVYGAVGELIGAQARATLSPDSMVDVPVSGAAKVPTMKGAVQMRGRKYISTFDSGNTVWYTSDMLKAL